MQTDSKTLQSQIDQQTDASAGPKAQGDAAEQSLPNATKYAQQVIATQFNDRTSPRK